MEGVSSRQDIGIHKLNLPVGVAYRRSLINVQVIWQPSLKKVAKVGTYVLPTYY